IRVLENPDDPASIPRAVETDREGRFDVEATTAGPFWLRVESRGLQPLLLKDLTPGEPLILRLNTGSAVRGRVVDRRSGDGIAEAEVWFCDRGAHRFGFAACPRFSAAADGRFRLDGIPNAPVRIGAASPEHAFLTIELPVERSADAFQLIELEEGGSLAGRVLDDQGRPVPGVRIGRDLYRVPFTEATEPLFDPPLISDEDGRFRHPGLSIPTRLSIRGLVDGWYGVPSNQVMALKGTVQELDLILQRPATLRFGLAPDGGELVQPGVRLLHRAAGGLAGPTAEAGEDGRYALEGLPTEPLDLKLTIAGYQPLDL
ncbi:MAG: hypothetical protein GTO30_16755, partial [Acidobacteria bacterium]|nr:hypothetical protein [Acidobacteriota bacterium]NIQ85032.1 hypothetical protein [Acidobacteriota bacterium]